MTKEQTKTIVNTILNQIEWDEVFMSTEMDDNSIILRIFKVKGR